MPTNDTLETWRVSYWGDDPENKSMDTAPPLTVRDIPATAWRNVEGLTIFYGETVALWAVNTSRVLTVELLPPAEGVPN